VTRPRKTASKRPRADQNPVTTGPPPWRILIVDPDTRASKKLTHFMPPVPVTFIQASNLAQAHAHLQEEPVDLAIIETDLPDGSGVQLVNELNHGRCKTQSILMGTKPTADTAIQAIRAGAVDFITKPIKPTTFNDCIRLAKTRQQSDSHLHRRVKRLRSICRKLNLAREEVGQQVDVLCNDLVTAYQELADQMQHLVQTKDFAATIHQDLDLENLLRHTLEYLVDRAGPTNAAIFLPANADEYSVGGYVNFDCTSESVDFLLQHLADHTAPIVATHESLVHLTDNRALHEWIGDESTYLADSHVVAFSCFHEEEALAIVVLFRDDSQPYTADLIQVCTSLGPMLGQQLAKLIRIHHRHLPDLDEEEAFDY